jgi:hypothetical protein
MTGLFVNLTLPKNGTFAPFFKRFRENIGFKARRIALRGKTRLARFGLTPIQITAVIAVFFVTSIGAVGLAYLLRKWNNL